MDPSINELTANSTHQCIYYSMASTEIQNSLEGTSWIQRAVGCLSEMQPCPGSEQERGSQLAHLGLLYIVCCTAQASWFTTWLVLSKDHLLLASVQISKPSWSVWVNLNSLPSVLAILSSFLSLPDLIYIHLHICPSPYGLTCWLGQDLGRPQVMLSHFSRLTGYSYLAELLLMRCLGSQPTIRSMATSWGAWVLCWSQHDWDSGKRWG